MKKYLGLVCSAARKDQTKRGLQQKQGAPTSEEHFDFHSI